MQPHTKQLQLVRWAELSWAHTQTHICLGSQSDFYWSRRHSSEYMRARWMNTHGNRVLCILFHNFIPLRCRIVARVVYSPELQSANIHISYRSLFCNFPFWLASPSSRRRRRRRRHRMRFIFRSAYIQMHLSCTQPNSGSFFSFVRI